ncbi:Uncharacterised protein [Citrobacter koseri]|uniref:Uncharacterized protein n=1 Tax=Citrobacter koseri TaxID=545 RepID=A0A3S4M656_CITKO|nr:Uncharacterised protein [Citrobacter koseri]
MREKTRRQAMQQRRGDCRRFINNQPVGRFRTRQQRIRSEKAKFLTGKLRQHVRRRFDGAVTMAVPLIREINCPASADFPRPRAAVTAATPGGIRSRCRKIAACSGCVHP